MGGLLPTNLVRQVADPAKLRAPLCGMCGLRKGCNSPAMPYSGNGKRRILVIGEAPGKQEDMEGTQFVGPAGRRLRRPLSNLHIDLDEDCFRTNALACRPPNNATPTSEQIAYCRPLVFDTIAQCNPSVIILLGRPAVESVLGNYHEVGDAIKPWVGWDIPLSPLRTWVVPTYHPSYVMREENKALDALFERHLEKAIHLSCMPMSGRVPHNLHKHIRCETRPSVAAKLIRRVRLAGGWVAFDYETNCLKPETPGARIVCCSISNGYDHIAYPWAGAAIDETCKLLHSRRCAKVAANAKFEDRWSAVHATHVRRWAWCTMVAAHILDNRQGITGLKFQSLVRLGVPDYSKHVKPYLEADRHGLNRIMELHLQDLLMYNGLDSACTWLLAALQAQDFETVLAQCQ